MPGWDFFNKNVMIIIILIRERLHKRYSYVRWGENLNNTMKIFSPCNLIYIESLTSQIYNKSIVKIYLNLSIENLITFTSQYI